MLACVPRCGCAYPVCAWFWPMSYTENIPCWQEMVHVPAHVVHACPQTHVVLFCFSEIHVHGCVLVHPRHAFDAQSLNGLATKIMRGTYAPIGPKYSPGLRELIAAMLKKEPGERPSLAAVRSRLCVLTMYLCCC